LPLKQGEHLTAATQKHLVPAKPLGYLKTEHLRIELFRPLQVTHVKAKVIKL
jgi:hypothetical protein